MYEELSSVSGDFDAVKSIGQIDKKKDKEVIPTTVAIGAGDGSVGAIDRP